MLAGWSCSSGSLAAGRPVPSAGVLAADPEHQRGHAAADDRQAEGCLEGKEGGGAGGQREGDYDQGVHEQDYPDGPGDHGTYPACLRVADPLGDLGVAARRELQGDGEQGPARRHGNQAGQPERPVLTA